MYIFKWSDITLLLEYTIYIYIFINRYICILLSFTLLILLCPFFVYSIIVSFLIYFFLLQVTSLFSVLNPIILLDYALMLIAAAAAAAAAKSLQSCPTLCNAIDRSPPGSPDPGILQARTLEWVAIAFSKCWLLGIYISKISFDVYIKFLLYFRKYFFYSIFEIFFFFNFCVILICSSKIL